MLEELWVRSDFINRWGNTKVPVLRTYVAIHPFLNPDLTIAAITCRTSGPRPPTSYVFSRDNLTS